MNWTRIAVVLWSLSVDVGPVHVNLVILTSTANVRKVRACVASIWRDPSLYSIFTNLAINIYYWLVISFSVNFQSCKVNLILELSLDNSNFSTW